MGVSTLLLFILTWNVAQKEPPANLKSLLKLPSTEGEESPDLYIIGLQEMNFFSKTWRTAFNKALQSSGYKRKKSTRLQSISGIMIMVFVKQEKKNFITRVEAKNTATGYYNTWGNKGATTICLDLCNVPTCFTNCHLAPHDGKVNVRVEQVGYINTNQKFRRLESRKILDNKLIFWFGDMNFRLRKSSSLDKKKIFELIRANDIKQLFEEDELMNLMKTEECFKNFQEQQVNFNPTYKFLPNSNHYNETRRPAWTDRILYRRSDDVELTPIKYDSVPSFDISDHKPVIGMFKVKAECEIGLNTEIDESTPQDEESELD